MADELTKDPFNPENDFFGELKDYQPEEIRDEADFKPLKGRYVGRISKLSHNIGVSTKDNTAYDFYSMNIQVTETIDGDKGDHRYLSKRYQNSNEGIKALMNDLFTAGIIFDKGSREAFDLSLPNAIDKQIRVRAWGWKPEKSRTGEPIPEEDRVAIQQLKVVNDFVKKGKKQSSEVPF